MTLILNEIMKNLKGQLIDKDKDTLTMHSKVIIKNKVFQKVKILSHHIKKMVVI